MPALGNALGLPFGKPSVNWTPASLLPTIWLDAGQLTGLVDGDAAGTLTACGSTTINFTAIGTLRGTYKTNQINGWPVIQLDGVDDYYVASAAANIKSFAVVAKYTNATTAVDYAGLFTGSGAGNDAYLVGSIAGQTQFYPLPVNVTFYKNGTAQAADVNGAAPMAAFAALVCTSTVGRNYTWSIGRDRGNSARSWLGEVAEIVASTAEWSAGEVAKIQSYFAAKYGI